jgi:ATP-dependent Lon protease
MLLLYYLHFIREKVIAAKRAGVNKLILPADNQGGFGEIPDHIRKGVKV